MEPKSNLIKRSLSGTVFVIVLIGCTIIGPLSMSWLFAVIAITGLFEFYKMIKKFHISPQYNLGIAISLVVYYYFFHHNFFPAERLLIEPSLSLVLLLISFVFINELFRKKENPIVNIAMTIFGIIYVVIPFALLQEIAHFKYSYEPRVILSLFFLIWTNDTFAYLTGSFLGKRKLLERISPGKTWEGFLGGGFFTLILAFFLNDVFPVDFHWHLSRIDWIIIGSIVFVFGTLGDLVESMLKRSVGVKDSGNVIAGHGGILDRFDSLIFVIPLIYGYLFFIKANLPYLSILLD